MHVRDTAANRQKIRELLNATLGSSLSDLEQVNVEIPFVAVVGNIPDPWDRVDSFALGQDGGAHWYDHVTDR